MSIGAGGSESLDLRESQRFNDPFFTPLQENLYSQNGSRQLESSPMQGFIPSSREAARNFQASILQPSSWRSSLGLDNQAQTSWRTGGGSYSTPGSSRGRSGYSGFELSNSEDINGTINPYTTGKAKFGGNENVFELSFQDELPTNIVRTGVTAGGINDNSGNVLGQSSYNFNKPYNFSESDSKDYDIKRGFGEGTFSREGQMSANLRTPSGGLSLDNSIQKRVEGSGYSKLAKTIGGDAFQNQYTTTADSSMEGAQEKQLDQLGMMMAPWYVSLPVNFAMEALAPDQRTTTKINSYINPRVESDLTQNTRIGMTSPGDFNYSDNARTSSMVELPGIKDSYAMSSIDTQGDQRASGRLSGNGSMGVSMLQNLGGVSNTDLTEKDVYETVTKFGKPETTNTMYFSNASGAQSQDATQAMNLQANNTTNLKDTTAPAEWVTANINKDLLDNFDSYKSRYPGLYGNFASKDDYINRKYLAQNPQTTLSAQQLAEIITKGKTESPDNYIMGNGVVTGSPENDLDMTNRQNVLTKSDLSLSGQAAANVINNVDVSTQQQTNNQRDDFVGALSGNWANNLVSPNVTVNPGASSQIDLNIESNQQIALQGLGAQADLVNELKYKFNDKDYGATLRLQAQRYINGLEEQLPMTRDTQNFINSLRSNPELVSLFEQGLPPETIVKATLDYDNANKEFASKLDWTSNSNYKQSQTYDPTPDKPNSGDEMALANIMGDVRLLDPGKLYNIGVTDEFSYTPDYKLTAPLTNISNEYITSDSPYSNSVKNDLYYYTNGINDLYNNAAQEFINRKYDLQTYDPTYQSSINELAKYNDIFSGANTDSAIMNDLYKGGYSAQDFTNIRDLLQAELEKDSSGNTYNPTQTGSVGKEFALPETENVNTNYGVFNIDPFYGFNRGKGLPLGRLDPRAANPTDAQWLEKYYNFSQAPGSSYVAYPTDMLGSNQPFMTAKNDINGYNELSMSDMVRAQMLQDNPDMIDPMNVSKYTYSDRTDYGAFNPYKGYSVGYNPEYGKALGAMTSNPQYRQIMTDQIMNGTYL
jgi:hypothetical protein